MGLKEELKDNSIIKKYRTQLIDSYVEQYGEKYRKLITENFDKIKFCFYISSDYFIYKQLMYQDLYHIYAVQLLNDLGISDVQYNGGYIESDRAELVEKLLNLIYSKISSNVISYDIFASFTKKNVTDFNNQDINFIEEITNRNIQEVIDIANGYISKIIDLNVEKEIHDAYEKCINYERKLDEDFSQYILNDFDINQFAYPERIKKMLCADFAIGTSYMELCKDGTYIPVAYIQPFSSKYRNIDVILDHEVRHCIEMYLNENNYLKSGLSYSNAPNDTANKFESKFRDINEIMTQKMSVESTKKRHDNNIFILTEKIFYDILKEKFRTTGYDRDIPLFDELVDEDLYDVLVEARINETYPQALEEEIERIERAMFADENEKPAIRKQ